MQAAWVTPVNKPRIIMSYFDAGIETSDIDVSRLIEKIFKKRKKRQTEIHTTEIMTMIKQLAADF